MVINHLLNGMILQVVYGSLCPIFWPLILTSWNKQIAPALSPRSSLENPSNRKLQASKVLGQERRYDKASNQSLGGGWLWSFGCWIPCNFGICICIMYWEYIYLQYIWCLQCIQLEYNKIIYPAYIKIWIIFWFPYILTCWNLWKNLNERGSFYIMSGNSLVNPQFAGQHSGGKKVLLP